MINKKLKLWKRVAAFVPCSIVMSHVYVFSSIILSDFMQKSAGVQCGAALPRCPSRAVAFGDCCNSGVLPRHTGGAARQAVRQEFLTKKPTKFTGKACADTCDDTA